MSHPTRIRQRKADDLPVPSGSEDPAERKRVLNILAQRRYRKRKREHVKALESQLNPPEIKAVPEPIMQMNTTQIVEDDVISNTGTPRDPSNLQPGLETISSNEWLVTHGTTTNPHTSTEAYSYPPHDAFYSDVGPVSLDHQSRTQPTISPPVDSATADLFAQPEVSAPETTMPDWVASSALCNDEAYLSGCGLQPSAWTWDPLDFTSSISLTSTPAPDLSSPENKSTPPTDLSYFSSSTSSASPPTSAKSPHPLATANLSNYTTAALQSHQATHTTFPDTSHLPTTELTLLRGFLSIATLLNLAPQIFSLTSTSPFNSPTPPSLPPNLPPNLAPTPLQRTTPHHPILDILPWPIVRNKLILVFSLPPHLRPLQAQSETALVDLVYDIEDVCEGVKVWGDSPFMERNWEVGSKVFGKWWWAFDGEIVKRSNELRMERGLGRLKMDSGYVVGEVG